MLSYDGGGLLGTRQRVLQRSKLGGAARTSFCMSLAREIILNLIRQIIFRYYITFNGIISVFHPTEQSSMIRIMQSLVWLWVFFQSRSLVEIKYKICSLAISTSFNVTVRSPQSSFPFFGNPHQFLVFNDPTILFDGIIWLWESDKTLDDWNSCSLFSVSA